MSSTLLEVTRASHEEVECLERIIVKDLQTEPQTNKDRLYQSHRVRNMVEQITSTTHKLIEIYEDNDNARKDEIAALGGQSSTGANVNVKIGVDCNKYIRNALVNVYGKYGPVGDAREVFDEMTDRSTADWNAMISGYWNWGSEWQKGCLFPLFFRS